MEQGEDSGNSLGLKIMFGLLFIIFIGEIMYFFIIPSKKPFIPITPIIPTFAPLTPTPMPTTVPTKAPTPFLNPSKGKVNLIQIIADNGEIIGLDAFKITPLPGSYNIEFSIKLKILSKDLQNTFFLVFDKKELNKLEVINETGQKISYRDLKVGQKIKINKKKDSNSDPFYSLEVSE